MHLGEEDMRARFDIWPSSSFIHTLDQNTCVPFTYTHGLFLTGSGNFFPLISRPVGVPDILLQPSLYRHVHLILLSVCALLYLPPCLLPSCEKNAIDHVLCDWDTFRVIFKVPRSLYYILGRSTVASGAIFSLSEMEKYCHADLQPN